MRSPYIKASRLLTLLLALPILSLQVFSQDCTKPASNYQQALVSIVVDKTKKETGEISKGYGTGFILSPDGYVLTASHVVEEDSATDEVKIYGAIGNLGAVRWPLEIIEKDVSKDVAILIFRGNSMTHQTVPLGNPFKVQMGGSLCSLSFSFPNDEDYHVTPGTLSTRTGQDKSRGIKTLWTTSMPSNSGESGAPVFDTTGGVVALKYGGRPPGEAQNVNYLIPINMAKNFIEMYTGLKVPDAGSAATDADDTATLQSIQVTFVLSNENKDYDTLIAMSLIKGNIIIADNADIAHGIAFNPMAMQKYGPYNLDIKTPVTKSLYKNSVVNITISPNGNDRWITGLIIEARFSDNRVISNSFNPFILDQDNRRIQFVIP